MQWLIFDAVGTLIAPREPVAVTYQAAAARFGSRLTVGVVRLRFHSAFARSEVLSFIDSGEPMPGLSTSEAAEQRRWRWVVRQIFDDVHEQERLFAELWRHFADPAAWIALPKAATTLHTLRQRSWRLGVASNFDGRLETVLPGLSELPAFDAMFVSSAVGCRKPAAEFYRRVIEACGVAAQDICIIGDHVEHDFTGPKQAGMRALLVDANAPADDVERVRSVAVVLQRLGAPPRLTQA